MRAVLVLATLVSAGCLAPGSDPGTDPVVDPQIPPSLGPAVDVALDCLCYEPTIAADPQGRLFVADGSRSDVAVSDDGGATWTTVPAPKMPGVGSGIQSDVLLQTSPSGRLYYSALLVRSTGVGFVLEGLQVAWSEDAGATWPVNAYLSPLSSPLDAVYSPDRQWLGFGEGETVFLTYNQIPSGIWAARSDDGGKTWGGWVRAVPVEDRRGVGQSGPPVVDGNGALLVPACTQAPANTVAVFASLDGGKSFARRDVTGAKGCSWFPIVQKAPDGSVVAAWHDGAGGIHVARTSDSGATWDEPVKWGASSSTSPWPFPGADGTLRLAWFEGDALRLTKGTIEGGPNATVDVGSTGATAGRTVARTDFAHGAVLPDGRLALVWTDGEGILVAVGT